MDKNSIIVGIEGFRSKLPLSPALLLLAVIESRLSLLLCLGCQRASKNSLKVRLSELYF
jgi:hypothetical protein